MIERERRIEAVVEKYRGRFSLVSIAVDTVTWCSFCVISIGIIINFSQRIAERNSSPHIYVMAAAVGLVAAAASLYSLYILEKMLEEICEELSKEPGATGYLFRTLGKVIPY